MCEMIMKISGIFLSEFHPTTGPMIKYQVPEEKITKDHFDVLQHYIITKPDLQGRLITVNALGWKILGCPVFIDDPKYKRNAYIFNLCFVFDHLTDTCSYEPVVKKLAFYLTQIELLSGFLSSPDSQSRVVPFLDNVLSMLNKYGSCSLQQTESCTVHLKVGPKITEPPPVQDHDVPIFIKDRKGVLRQGHWDLTTQQIMPYIDGINHVAKIAAEGDVEINLVKLCLQNLLYYEEIKLISVFQYANVYTVTPNIQKLYADKRLQEECITWCARKAHSLPCLRDVFLLYSSLRQGVTVKDMCYRYNPHGMKIDERKLIQFGLKKDLIRRIHKYPIKLSQDMNVSHLFDGVHSTDEICSKTGLSQAELDDRMDGDPLVVVCSK